MSSKFQAPKGTKDHLFDSFAQRQWVSDRMLRTCERYGFRQIQTPVFEYLEVLEAKAGPDIRGQIYSFQDKGGRELGLRAEHTASIARVVASEITKLPKPVKIAAYGTVYRYERPQSGRQREFTQVNVEMYGAQGALADAEVIACFVDCYREIGLSDFEIRISDRRLLDAILEKWQVNDIAEVIRTIDKMDKMKPEKWRELMLKTGLSENNLDQLTKILAQKGKLEETSAIFQELGLEDATGEVIENLKLLETHLDALGVGDLCRFDFSIARGLEYYTGVIFECAPTDMDFGSIGGGGRYDKLIGLYGGQPTPAVGFAVGLERVMLLLEKRATLPQREEGLRVLVAWYDESCLDYALQTLRNIRGLAMAEASANNRIEAQIVMSRQAFKKQFQYADKIGATHVIIAGPDEVENRRLKIKNLQKGTEQTTDLIQGEEAAILKQTLGLK